MISCIAARRRPSNLADIRGRFQAAAPSDSELHPARYHIAMGFAWDVGSAPGGEVSSHKHATASAMPLASVCVCCAFVRLCSCCYEDTVCCAPDTGWSRQLAACCSVSTMPMRLPQRLME